MGKAAPPQGGDIGGQTVVWLQGGNENDGLLGVKRQCNHVPFVK